MPHSISQAQRHQFDVAVCEGKIFTQRNMILISVVEHMARYFAQSECGIRGRAQHDLHERVDVDSSQIVFPC